MFKGLQVHAVIWLVFGLASSGIAEAQAFGRVTVVVRNVEGKPLEGVDVTVTCDEITSYRHETQTNKKGKAVVSFTDATKTYKFHFAYEDFQPADMPIKPEIRGNLTREVTLTEGQVVSTDQGEVSYTAAERVFNEGVVALKGGDLEGAKASFLAAIEKDDKLSAAYSALAGVHLEQKDPQAALSAIERYRELEPDNPNGWFMLYDAHSALGNQKEADDALKALKASDRSGDTVALIFNAGVAAMRVGNSATAKARFLEALELDPSLDAAVGALTLIFHREGDHQKAAEYAEKHLVMEPGDPQSLRIRWDAYEQLGDEENSKTAFRGAGRCRSEGFGRRVLQPGCRALRSGRQRGRDEGLPAGARSRSGLRQGSLSARDLPRRYRRHGRSQGASPEVHRSGPRRPGGRHRQGHARLSGVTAGCRRSRRGRQPFCC